jgi:hypothetical protein
MRTFDTPDPYVPSSPVRARVTLVEVAYAAPPLMATVPVGGVLSTRTPVTVRVTPTPNVGSPESSVARATIV